MDEVRARPANCALSNPARASHAAEHVVGEAEFEAVAVREAVVGVDGRGAEHEGRQLWRQLDRRPMKRTSGCFPVASAAWSVASDTGSREKV